MAQAAEIRAEQAADIYETLEGVAKELYIKALKEMPPDVRRAIAAARQNEVDEQGKMVLDTILRNIEVADDRDLLVCQDTGTPVYFVDLGTEIAVNPVRLQQALKRGTERACKEHPLRSSIVTVLGRKNHQTATGHRIPVIHWDFVDGADYVDLLMVPKGSGSENMTYFKMLLPADGVEGVKRFVIDSVVNSGAMPCPPVVVGVGLGGSSDLAMSLAKKAISRAVDERNADPEMAALEHELLDLVNETGIGPQGLGGLGTAMAVNIEHADTHISSIPVAVNIQCWAARRAKARVWLDGRVQYGF